MGHPFLHQKMSIEEELIIEYLRVFMFEYVLSPFDHEFEEKAISLDLHLEDVKHAAVLLRSFNFVGFMVYFNSQ